MHSPDVPPLEAPLAKLERAFIDEYLRLRGYDASRLAALPAAERDALLKDASVYASARLSEVESRSRYIDEMHLGTEIPRAGHE